MKKTNIYLILLFLVLVSALVLIFNKQKINNNTENKEQLTQEEKNKSFISPENQNKETPPKETPSLPNPASQNCQEKGGKIIIKKDGSGGEYGICELGDRACEEWTLFRGECPSPDGVKITNYTTEAEKFCALTGGTVNAEAKICIKNGKECDLDEYFQRKCK